MGGSECPEAVTPNPNIVDWNGPDDPANPMNWTLAKKSGVIAVISAITFLSFVFPQLCPMRVVQGLTYYRPLGSTIIAPGTDLLMKDFNSTSGILAAFVTSVYLVGYIIGPLFLAPLSELYGRSIFYHASNVVCVVFNIACAAAPNLGSVIVFRFFAGMAASCPITLGSGTIADMIPPERRGLAMAIWMIGPLIGPAIGPISTITISTFIGNW